MTRVTYVNGRYVPHDRAAVHVEDRGYQFADGVYEVVEVRRGELIDEAGHPVLADGVPRMAQVPRMVEVTRQRRTQRARLP